MIIVGWSYPVYLVYPLSIYESPEAWNGIKWVLDKAELTVICTTGPFPIQEIILTSYEGFAVARSSRCATAVAQVADRLSSALVVLSISVKA